MMRGSCVLRGDDPPHRGVLGADSRVLYSMEPMLIFTCTPPCEVFISESIQFVIVFTLVSIFSYSGYFCYLVTFLFHNIHCFVAFPLCENIFIPFCLQKNNNYISTEMIFLSLLL